MKSKIGRKIGFAFLTLLILIGMMVGVTFIGFNTVTESLNEMEQEAVKRGASGNLRFSITQLLMTSNDYIITEKDYYKREFIRMNLKVDDYYNQFIQLKLTDEEQKLTEKILQCLDSIRAFSEKIFSIQHPRLSPNAWELMETMDYRFGEDVNIKTTQIFEGISHRIENLRIQAAADKGRTANSIYIMLLSAIFISILVSYLTVQRISKPIISVVKAANGIANGDYSQRPKVKTHDEIAVLAESFSSMADSIQKSQKRLEESKKLTEAIVATVPVGLLVYDSTGKILSVNNSFCNFFDLFQNLPLYQNISSLFNELTVTEACIDHILSRNSVKNVECCFSDAKKGKRIFNLTILPLKLTDGESLLMLQDITDQKKAEDELKIIYTAVEQAAECVFITDRNGVIQYVNKAFEYYCGYSKEEALGQTPRILSSGHHPEKFFKNLWDTILAGNVFSGMIVNKHKNGELVYEEKIITPIKDEKNNITHFVATAKVVTEQILVKKALKKSEERLQTALKNSPIVVYNQDKDLRYTWIYNPHPSFTVNQILGKTDFDLLTPEDAEKVTAIKRKVLETGVSSRQEIKLTIEGGEFYYDLTVEPLRDEDDTIMGVTAAAMEITERKRAEEENHLLLTLTKSITEAGDFDSALTVALRMINESTGWDFGEVWIPSHDGSYLECSPSWHSNFGNTRSFRRASEAFRFEPGIGLPGCVWSSKKSVWIPDVTVDPNFPRAPFAKEVGFRAGVGIPILTENGLVAVICFFLSQVRQEDERMVSLISAVAAQLGTLFERKRAEQEIISQKNKFAQLFENSPVAIVLLDDKDKIIHINESFSALFGYYLEEIKGKTLSDFIVPDELKEEARYFSDETLGGSQIYKESYRKKKDGALVFVNIIGIPIIINEQLVGIYGMYVDMTQRKEAEEEMRLAKELAEQSSKLKDTFIANISHEIRTPLNAILGYSGLISDTFSQYASASKDELDYFQAVDEASNRLMRTVEMILTLSRLSIDEFPVTPEPINLSSIINNLINEYKLKVEKKSLVLSFDNKCGNVNLIADEYSITQAVSNLIDNALKYTKQGFVKLALYTNEQNEFLLDVADSGIGISEEYMKHIFEPYSQEEIGYSRTYEGIGLGLSIVKKFLALNEADISVHSTKGKGSTFTIRFSATKWSLRERDAFAKVEHPSRRTKNFRQVGTGVDGASDLQIQARKIKSTEKSKKKIMTSEEIIRRKLSILLVEDDELNQRYIQSCLKTNYNTIIVSSAHEALEILKANPIELILMDISLKGELNGLELTKIIRETEEYSKIPIIAVTAHAFAEDRQRSLEAGCNQYLSKPFKSNELLENITELIGEKQ